MSRTTHVTEDRFEFDPDIRAARKFQSLLDPDAEEFDFRAIWPKEKPGGERHPLQKLRGHLDDKGFVRKLKRLSEDSYGIFVTVNETDGQGVKATNIIRPRAVWADLDHGKPDHFPLTPSFSVETSPGKYQAYWLVHGKMTPGEFDGVMSRIVQDYRGDPGAKDIARVLRVPGFYHTKSTPFRCRIVDYIRKGDIDYTAAELLKAFPLVESKTGKAGKRRRTGALAAVARDFDPETVASALDALPDHFGTDYNTKTDEGWRNIMFAIHAGSGGARKGGKSSTSGPVSSTGTAGRTTGKLWDAAEHDRDDKISLGTLFHFAKAYGWQRPAKGQHQSKSSKRSGVEKKEAKWLLNTYGKPADHINNVEHFISDLMDIKPWRNEFDGEYYLEENGQSRRLDDTALRDLRMQLHKLDCRISIDLMESGVKWLADQQYQPPPARLARTALSGMESAASIRGWQSTWAPKTRHTFELSGGRP